jgi:hypothetical protein
MLSRLKALRVQRRGRPRKGKAMSALQRASFSGVSFVSLSPAAAAAAMLQRLTSAWRRHAGIRAKASMGVEFCCGAHLALARREFVVLSGVRQQTLVCEAGEIWVTLEGQGTDHLLGSGESLAIVRTAKVLVSAIKPSVVRVMASSAAGDGQQRARIGSSRTSLRQPGQAAAWSVLNQALSIDTWKGQASARDNP